MKKYLLWTLLAAGLLTAGVALSAPILNYSRTIYPEVTNTYELGTSTKAWIGITGKQFCLTGDSCIASWPTGGGSGSSVGWATTTNAVYNNFGYMVGINSSTPNANLVVQGSSTAPTIPVLIVASSTGTALLTVTQAGNVGIGTAAPTANLEINPTTADPAILVSGVNGSTNAYITVKAANTSGKQAFFNINNLKNATGYQQYRVGSPHDNGQSFTIQRLNDGASSITEALMLQDTSGNLGFLASSGAIANSKLYISAAGNVGIATITPASKLHIAYDATSTASTLHTLQLGDRPLTSPSANGTYLAANTPTSFTGNLIDIQVNGTSNFKVTSAGAVSGSSGTFTGALQSASWTDTINTISTFASRTTFRKTSSGVTEFVVSPNVSQSADNSVLKVSGTDYGASPNTVWLASYSTCGSGGCTGFTGLTGTANSALLGVFNDGASPPTGFHDLIVMTQNNSTGGVTVLREAMRVKAGTTPNVNFFSGLQAGRIGIGSSSPTALLTVNGTSSSPSEVLLNVASSTYASLFNVQSGGNVGIGTSTPQTKLAVSGVYGSTEPATTTISTAAYTMDLSAGNFLPFSVATSTTITFSNAQPGPAYYLEMKQDGTGSRTMTFSNCSWSGGAAPTFTTTANKTDLVVVRYSASFNKYYCQSSLNY